MGALIFCLFYCVSMLFVTVVVGINIGTAPGVVAAFLVTGAVFASADLSMHLVGGPLHRVFQPLLRARELGSLLTILFMFAVVGGIAGGVIWGWAQLAPIAFSSNPMLPHEAFRLGFSAAILNGFLVLIGFPNRFARLAELAARYQRRS
ncbi:MAG: hypothetical protein IT343_02885 [Candidatus Melainabacteria bacterium]|jgi:hypothetical protein|nr:hypothetical protein [Candidatus Melainabacteria bacterium]